MQNRNGSWNFIRLRPFGIQSSGIFTYISAFYQVIRIRMCDRDQLLVKLTLWHFLKQNLCFPYTYSHTLHKSFICFSKDPFGIFIVIIWHQVLVKVKKHLFIFSFLLTNQFDVLFSELKMKDMIFQWYVYLVTWHELHKSTRYYGTYSKVSVEWELFSRINLYPLLSVKLTLLNVK